MIRDGNGTILEQGDAEQTEVSWWTYTTQEQANGARQLEITVLDLPGNHAQKGWQNSNLPNRNEHVSQISI